MAGYSDLSAAYSRTPIVVWVEDDVTKQYLTEVWNDNGVSFLIAGSNEAVHAVVGDADLNHVFGIVDRDFGRTNYDKWLNPDSSFKVFRLPVSEIENYLLDAQCIAGCNVNFNHRSESEVEERIAVHAQTMVCWLACRDVLADYHDDIVKDFPFHPRQNIDSSAAAESYIREQSWFQDIADRVANLSEQLPSKLQTAEAERRAQLASGDWRVKYSGKELFREVRGYVFQPSSGSSTERDIAFARSVAKVQVLNSTVPDSLQTLLTALKTRVGI